MKEGVWQQVYQGDALSDESIQSFMGYGFGEIDLKEPQETQQLRIHIEKASGIPSIYSVRLK